MFAMLALGRAQQISVKMKYFRKTHCIIKKQLLKSSVLPLLTITFSEIVV